MRTNFVDGEAWNASVVNGVGVEMNGKAASTHTHTTSQVTDATETVQDLVAAMVVQGANITKTYDDTAGTLTIATPATVNDTDANLRARANHTGTQLSGTISDFTTAVQTVVGGGSGVQMAAPSGDTTGTTDNNNLLAAQAQLPAGRGNISFKSGVYWLPKDCGNIKTGQHWWGSGNGTVLRMAAGQNGNFIRTNNWATYITSGATDIITATKTGTTVPFPGNTITMANTSGIAVGDLVMCPGFVNGTWVTAININTSVTCSTQAQYVGAGVTASFSGVPMDWGIHHMVLDGNGYFAFNIANQLNPPTGLAVTTSGTAGTTFYRYKVTAVNAVGETQGCQPVTITTGNATLTATNRNNVSWTAVSGATGGYNIYRAKYDVLGSELLLAHVASGTTTYQDTSLTDPNTGIIALCPMTNSSGGRVLASYGYAFTLENVDIAYGAGVGFDSTGLPTTNNNFGNNYNATMHSVHIRACMGGGMRLAGPTDMVWDGADFNANGATGGGAGTNGLVDLDLLTTGLSLSNFHFYGGGVQNGKRIAGAQCMFTNGQMEEGYTFLAIITGNFNILDSITAYNVSAGVDTPCAFYVAGQSNQIGATIENTAGGIIQFGLGENGGDYDFRSSYWTCARPATPYIGLPHDTRSLFSDLVEDTFGTPASYLISNRASYEIRSATTKTVPAADDQIAVVETAWPYNMKRIPYANFNPNFDFTPLVASTTQTLTVGKPVYAFTGGSTVTWTLPSIASTIGSAPFRIKNRGSAALTISRAGSDQIYDTAAVSTISVAAGAAVMLVNDGTFWDKT